MGALVAALVAAVVIAVLFLVLDGDDEPPPGSDAEIGTPTDDAPGDGRRDEQTTDEELPDPP